MPEDPASNERLVRDVPAEGSCRLRPLPRPQEWCAHAGSRRRIRVGDICTGAAALRCSDSRAWATTDTRPPCSPARRICRSALNPAAAAGCVGMWSPVAPHPRLSLNLTALLDSRRIVVLITGESKWRTYTAACAPGPRGGHADTRRAAPVAHAGRRDLVAIEKLAVSSLQLEGRPHCAQQGGPQERLPGRSFSTCRANSRRSPPKTTTTWRSPLRCATACCSAGSAPRPRTPSRAREPSRICRPSS